MLDTDYKELITAAGYPANSIERIPEGYNRDVFFVTVGSDRLVAKFEREAKLDKRDIHFGGPLSFSREAGICRFLRKADIPVPEIIGVHTIEGHEFLLESVLPGVSFAEYMKQHDYSLRAYLDTVEKLGGQVARAHRLHLDTFGDFIEEGVVLPLGVTDFKDRLRTIINYRLQRNTRGIRPENLDSLEDYLTRQIDDLPSIQSSPNFVLFDLNPLNFFVNQDGTPCGFCDLDRSQAAVPSVEFYSARSYLLSYFGRPTHQEAKNAFFKGYSNEGGCYDENDTVNKTVESVLYLTNALIGVSAYHDAHDGIRDDWSGRFKDLLLTSLLHQEPNWVGFGDILRGKIKNPAVPNLP